MNSIKLKAIFVAIAMTLAGSVFAAQETLDITWSGASFGNNATATGFITFDNASLPQNSVSGNHLPDAAITNLGITISGASSGNGTFNLSDFTAITFWAPSPLDLSKQLIGQTLTNGSTYGTSSPNGGDFNLFGNFGTSAPAGRIFFRLATNGGAGDDMLVTSMMPVPEPAESALLISGLGLIGFIASRRKKPV